MKLRSLKEPPLYDAVVEIRFTPSIPEDAVTGYIYSKISDEFSKNTVLPASQFPKPMRESDPNLKYQPTNKFESKTYYLNVGSNVMGLGWNLTSAAEYPGWKSFYQMFKSIMRKVQPITQNIERIGIRYVNFFQEKDLLENLNIEFKPALGSKVSDETIVFLSHKDGLVSKVSVANSVILEDLTGTKKGQILDIDTYIEGGVPTEDLHIQVEKAHENTEEIFISLLKSEFIKKMGPSWDESHQ